MSGFNMSNLDGRKLQARHGHRGFLTHWVGCEEKDFDLWGGELWSLSDWCAATDPRITAYYLPPPSRYAQFCDWVRETHSAADADLRLRMAAAVMETIRNQ